MVNRWAGLVFLLLECGLYCWFLLNAMEPKVNRMLIFLFVACLHSLSQIIVFGAGALSLIPSLVIDFSAAVLLFRGQLSKKLFLVLIFYAFLFVFDLSAAVIVPYVYYLRTGTAVNVDALTLTATAFSRVLVCHMVLLLGRSLKAELRLREWMMILPTPVVSALLLMWVYPLVHTLDYQTGALLVVICTLSLLLNLFLLSYTKRAYERIRLTARLEALQEMRAMQEKHLHDLRGAYRQSEKAAHDFRQHLNYLEAADSLGAVTAYVRQLRGRGLSGMVSYTGNFDVDVILYATQKSMADIRLSVKGFLPERIPWIQPVDLSILLGNALSNAQEAAVAAGGGEVRVSFVYDESWLLVSVENPAITAPEPKASGRGFRSTKKEAGHGFGTENMQDVVDRHNGHMSGSIRDGIFTLDILIQQEE